MFSAEHPNEALALAVAKGTQVCPVRELLERGRRKAHPALSGDDPDVAWVVQENRKKKRLLVLLSS